MSKRPNWSEDTAVILASGPSLRDQYLYDLDQRYDVQTIAVNSSFGLIRPNVVFGVDFLFWKTHHDNVAKKTIAARWTTDRTAAERYGLNFIKGSNTPGLGKSHVHTQCNSGMAAINLAYLFGAKKIILLGFDMKLGPNGEKHHHADHPAPLVQGQQFGDWLHKAQFLARDLDVANIDVVNCTPGSALTAFRLGKLEEELP